MRISSVRCLAAFAMALKLPRMLNRAQHPGSLLMMAAGKRGQIIPVTEARSRLKDGQGQCQNK
jgi:hypothetical protein